MISDELILAGKLQLKKLQKKKPEKNSGFDGAWTSASQILVGRSTNWATKPHVGSEANFSGSFLPREGVFITNNIWNNLWITVTSCRDASKSVPLKWPRGDDQQIASRKVCSYSFWVQCKVSKKINIPYLGESKRSTFPFVVAFMKLTLSNYYIWDGWCPNPRIVYP